MVSGLICMGGRLSGGLGFVCVCVCVCVRACVSVCLCSHLSDKCALDEGDVAVIVVTPA